MTLNYCRNRANVRNDVKLSWKLCERPRRHYTIAVTLRLIKQSLHRLLRDDRQVVKLPSLKDRDRTHAIELWTDHRQVVRLIRLACLVPSTLSSSNVQNGNKLSDDLRQYISAKDHQVVQLSDYPTPHISPDFRLTTTLVK